jgi:hypothetical protein
MTGRYRQIQDAIFQVFATPAWLSEDIKTIPVNFSIPTSDSEFLTVNIVPSGAGVNRVSNSGLLIATIYVQEGRGPSRAAEIADILDGYLMGKTFNTSGGNVQFSTSAFSPRGAAKTSPFSLFEYSLPFNFFGAI